MFEYLCKGVKHVKGAGGVLDVCSDVLMAQTLLN